jgi:hypothetical protein
MRVVVVALGVVVASWVVFWGVAGAYVAQRRSEPTAPAAALAVLLGPVGMAILLLRSRHRPTSSPAPTIVAGDDLI